MSTDRRPHLDLRLVLLVTAGGRVGTAGRAWLVKAVPTLDGWPTATLVANLAGSFLLGLLLEALIARGPETNRLRGLRLGLGTGVLGGFTTYSSFAVEMERLVIAARPGLAAAYAAVSLAGGLAACVAGIWVGGGTLRARGPRGRA